VLLLTSTDLRGIYTLNSSHQKKILQNTQPFGNDLAHAFAIRNPAFMAEFPNLAHQIQVYYQTLSFRTHKSKMPAVHIWPSAKAPQTISPVSQPDLYQVRRSWGHTPETPSIPLFLGKNAYDCSRNVESQIAALSPSQDKNSSMPHSSVTEQGTSTTARYFSLPNTSLQDTKLYSAHRNCWWTNEGMDRVIERDSTRF
jgi:hypothetical protein